MHVACHKFVTTFRSLCKNSAEMRKNMNIKRAKQEIKNTVKAYLTQDENGRYKIDSIRQRPILLIGPPGIGKTAIMEQVARECKIGLAAYTMTHHTRQSAMGLPFIEKKVFDGKEYSVTSYTMSEIIASVNEIMENTGVRQGILFIDEINCVSETLLPIMLQFLQAKTFGNAKVPNGWIIVAAGNPAEYNHAVRDFDVVTLDRVKYIEVEPDYAIWKEYAIKQEMHRSILSYLDARQEHFYQIETTIDGKRFVTARGWEDLSTFLKAYEAFGIEADIGVIEQYIRQPDIAMDYANYLSLYYKYEKAYSVTDILEGKVSDSMYKRAENAPFDERISIVSLMLGSLNTRFKQYYYENKCAEEVFQILKKFQQNQSLDFSELTKEYHIHYIEQKRGNLLENEDLDVKLKVLEIISGYDELLKVQSEKSHDEKFLLLTKKFAELSDRLEKIAHNISENLEYSFDFAEEVFSMGPEMVLFVTELAAGFYSLAFIQENGCERFYQYNKSMLRDSAREQLLQEIII